MEDHTPDLSIPATEPLCMTCQQEPVLPGYNFPICATCRQKHIKYPIPKWIYAFGAGIVLVMVVALVRMPPYLRLAIDLGKAEKAIEAHKYVTAERTLKKVIAEFPNLQEPKAYMLIAACYNLDLEMARMMDADLKKYLNIFPETRYQTEAAYTYITSQLYVDTTITEKIDAAMADSVQGLVNLYYDVDSSEDDARYTSAILIANKLYDIGHYQECKEICQQVLQQDPHLYIGFGLLSATYRRMHEYAAALAVCDTALHLNLEDVSFIAGKAKIELVRKDYKKSAEYVAQAVALEPENLVVLEAKALLDYYTGNKDAAYKTLATIRDKDNEGERIVYNRTLAVLNGTKAYN